jgi:WD40 repeat protein/transcriptional regulator with XRE-family HTH domain
MKRPDIGEPDVSFNQILLTLRNALDLTQAELARQLGVSRRAIGGWEAGDSYPKTTHLKHFIELAVQQQIFSAGREVEEIRRLWKKAHQKELLNEQWLQAILAQAHSQDVHVTPVGVGVELVSTPTPTDGPRVDWGDALTIQTFYGREQEMAVLSTWIVQERCRVVSVLGMGGIGKSALAVRTMYNIAEQFEVVIFRALRDAPSCEALLDDCLQVLSLQSLDAIPATLEQRLTLLLEYLSKTRTLIVLDNLESLLDEEELTGRFHPGFEAYEQLLRRLAQNEHQSCLLLTSREKAAVIRPLESRTSPVRSLRLSGLDVSAGEQLLIERGVKGTIQDKAHLIELYAGNPLALRIVSEIITDLFDGYLEQFLAAGTIVFGSIIHLLDEQWARLSTLEQSLLYWLAILREPVTLEELQAVQVRSPLRGALGALDSLHRRSLIEQGQRPGSFTLQSVVLEYVTAALIAVMSEEIEQKQLHLLIQHGLEIAQSREDIRQAQERVLLHPVLECLQSSSRIQPTVDTRFLMLLDQLRECEEYAQGYGPANLVALLRLWRGHLRGLDLSQTALRGAYLQGVEMQDTNLSEATLRDTTFTETMHPIWSVAISRTGQYWAAGSLQGNVRVWRENGQRLYLSWQAHTNTITSVAFSPDERTLATSSWDGTIKLWELQSGALFWIGRHSSHVYRIAFSPDGQMLASGGLDPTFRLWEVSSGKQIHTRLSPDGGVISLAWSPDGRWLATGCWDGSIRIWQIGPDGPCLASDTRALVGHNTWVRALTFAPDSTQLASGSWDGTVKQWDVISGRLLQTLTGHTQKVYDVLWSPDGRTIASASEDQRICLWDVAQQSYRAVLHGHSATIHRLAFTPDSLRLLSGSEDSTLRLWEVNSGQCVRILQGYAIRIYDIDWNPQSTCLASGSSDGHVLQWERFGKTQPRMIGTHQGLIYGVAWSPDGRLLASSGWDSSPSRIWDPTTGTCQHLLRDPNHAEVLFFRVSWSPDGRLLAWGSYQQGIYVWDVEERHIQVLEKTKSMTPHRLAWSPDGSRLASGSTDGRVCLWKRGAMGDIATDTIPQQLPGHQRTVTCLAWSPDGTRLVSASGGRLTVWEVQSGECLQDFVGLCDLVSAVTWDRSGDLLISGGNDGMLRWWKVQSGTCLRESQAHEETIWSLKRSPDGRWLASGGDDGAIRIWDLYSAELVQTLRRDRPYERLNITGIQGLTEAQKANLRTLGAIEDPP